LNAFGLSDTGKVRQNNEDSIFFKDAAFFALPNIYVVADGMGGHNSGEVASAKAIEFFTEYCQTINPDKNETLDYLIDAANYANAKVYDLSRSDEQYSGMGTTFSACCAENGKLYAAHIGDSRIYLISGKEIKQLTYDHTFVNEMVRAGQMTAEQAKQHHARNMLTRALGSERVAVIDGYVADCGGAKVLLCSDGLTNMVPDDQILKICNKNKKDNAKTVKLLTKAALDAGGIDNCSVIVFDCGEGR
jgi:protein phosphatase